MTSKYLTGSRNLLLTQNSMLESIIRSWWVVLCCIRHVNCTSFGFGDLRNKLNAIFSFVVGWGVMPHMVLLSFLWSLLLSGNWMRKNILVLISFFLSSLWSMLLSGSWLHKNICTILSSCYWRQLRLNISQISGGLF